MSTYLVRTFSALRSRNYRIYALGQSISVSGTWMQKVAQVLLVLQLTDSGVALGVTASLQHVPALALTAWAGLLADRFDKRLILITTQALAAVPALILGVLTATDSATIGVVLVLAFVLGCLDALDKPARFTFVSDLVDKQDLTNAVTLNSIVQNTGKVVGPALAGILIATIGLASTFFINAASFAAVLIALLMIRPIRKDHGPRPHREPGQLREALRYVRSHPDLRGALILMAVSGLLAYNWSVVLPLLALDSFDAGPTEVGLAFTAMGTGGVVGGLALAGMLRPTRGSLVTWALIFASATAVLALSPSLHMAYLFMFILGATSVAFRTVANSLLQVRSTPEMRGRVIALFVLAINGTTPVGGPLVGWICEHYGVRTNLLIAAGGTGLATLWAIRVMRPRRAPEQPGAPAEGLNSRAGPTTTPPSPSS